MPEQIEEEGFGLTSETANKAFSEGLEPGPGKENLTNQ